MKKGQLKALFIEAKGTGQKYIGVMIQTEGSSEPEVIINPKENFNAKFDYYMAAYDDDLILIAAKGKKDIRITGAAAGASFEDIQSQLIDEKASSGWKEQIADAVDRVVDKMLKETPPGTEEEGYKYDALEAVYIKGKSYEDIVRETGCGKNSPKKWCRSMTERLSIKLFGAKAIENDKIGVK